VTNFRVALQQLMAIIQLGGLGHWLIGQPMCRAGKRGNWHIRWCKGLSLVRTLISFLERRALRATHDDDSDDLLGR
jgi:hypothetical protein